MDADFLKSIGIDADDIAQKIIEKQQEEESGLISKRDELLGKVNKYKDDLARFDGVDPAKYKEALAKLEEIGDAESMKNGDIEAIRQKLLDQFAEKEKTYQDQASALRSQLENILIEGEAVKAISEHGGNSKLLLPLIKQRIKAVDKDGKLMVEVFGEDGVQAIDNDGKPLSIGGLVESMKVDETFAGAFASSGLSGGGSQGSKTATATDDSGLFGASRMAAARAK